MMEYTNWNQALIAAHERRWAIYDISVEKWKEQTIRVGKRRFAQGVSR